MIGSSAKLYLAAMLDLYSRFVVGWAVSAVNDRHLALRALDMALKRRCPDAGLLHHSDQGRTYASGHGSSSMASVRASRAIVVWNKVAGAPNSCEETFYHATPGCKQMNATSNLYSPLVATRLS